MFFDNVFGQDTRRYLRQGTGQVLTPSYRVIECVFVGAESETRVEKERWFNYPVAEQFGKFFVQSGNENIRTVLVLSVTAVILTVSLIIYFIFVQGFPAYFVVQCGLSWFFICSIN